MRQPKNADMVKATARERLYGQYGTTIGAAILFAAIQLIISNIVVVMVSPSNILTYIIYLLSLFLVDIFLGVFYSGMAYLYMNVIYAQPVSAKDFWHGFASHPDKALVLQIPFSVAYMLQSVPLSVWLNFYRESGNVMMRNILIAIAAVGLVMMIAFNLVFSQVFYLLQDFPDKSPEDIFRISADLMNGNKFRLFKLYLSFIPMIILGILTFFIPLLWVNAYMEASQAAFYQDLIAVSSQNSME
ncbi:DUF975 family protein [Butyrivibrio sp. AE3006]|uniref:DUF975 family protein n=1 Tax=Butyrivibrio sp. AE3006 TaxID=1280673 RepID=UPI000415ECFD|nr:DUF975 family protein [Butyrivibrio sp. AE3006]